MFLRAPCIFNVFSAEQPLNAAVLMFSRVCGNTTSCRAEQAVKAPSPIFLRFCGNAMRVKATQLLKALALIFLRVRGMLMVTNCRQAENADESMSVMEFGRLTFFNFEQLLKVSSKMDDIWP